MTNIRFLLSFVAIVGLAFSLALASNDGEKTKKPAPAKKEIKSCCSAETKNAKSHEDVEMKDSGAKETRSSKHVQEAKTEKKMDGRQPEKK